MSSPSLLNAMYVHEFNGLQPQAQQQQEQKTLHHHQHSLSTGHHPLSINTMSSAYLPSPMDSTTASNHHSSIHTLATPLESDHAIKMNTHPDIQSNMESFTVSSNNQNHFPGQYLSNNPVSESVNISGTPLLNTFGGFGLTATDMASSPRYMGSQIGTSMNDGSATNSFFGTYSSHQPQQNENNSFISPSLALSSLSLATPPISYATVPQSPPMTPGLNYPISLNSQQNVFESISRDRAGSIKRKADMNQSDVTGSVSMATMLSPSHNAIASSFGETNSIPIPNAQSLLFGSPNVVNADLMPTATVASTPSTETSTPIRKPRKSTLRSSHDPTESKPKPFKCPYEGCDASFPRMYNLKSHVLCHTGDKPHVCPHNCGAAFARKHDLQRHLRTLHSPDRPFPCPFAPCTNSFLRASAFWRHLVEDHEDRGESEHTRVYHAAVQRHQKRLQEEKITAENSDVTGKDVNNEAISSLSNEQEKRESSNDQTSAKPAAKKRGGKRTKGTPAITLQTSTLSFQSACDDPTTISAANSIASSPGFLLRSPPSAISSSSPYDVFGTPQIHSYHPEQGFFISSPMQPTTAPTTPLTPFIDVSSTPYLASSSLPSRNGISGFEGMTSTAKLSSAMDFNYMNGHSVQFPQSVGQSQNMTTDMSDIITSPFISPQQMHNESGVTMGSGNLSEHHDPLSHSWTTWFGGNAPQEHGRDSLAHALSSSLNRLRRQIGARKRSLSHSGIILSSNLSQSWGPHDTRLQSMETEQDTLTGCDASALSSSLTITPSSIPDMISTIDDSFQHAAPQKLVSSVSNQNNHTSRFFSDHVFVLDEDASHS